MATVTFGSVGDIISICEIIRKTVSALSEARGSAAEYQGLINELWSLAQALESLRSLLTDGTKLQHRGRLQIALSNCRECLERELGSLEKFQTSLSKVGRAKSARDAFWRIRWLGHKDDLNAFRRAVSFHLDSIGLLLQASGIQLSQTHHRETSTQLNEFSKRVKKDFGEIEQNAKRRCNETTRLLSEIQDASVDQNQALKSQMQSSSCSIISKLDTSHSALVQIQDSSQQSLQLLTALLGSNGDSERSHAQEAPELLRRLVSLLRQPIPNHLEKAPLVYEDALLRKFSIDLEFIPSYDVFQHVIRSHYEGTEGERKIVKQEYRFEDKNRKSLDLARVWSSDILSGKNVFMRVTFDDIDDCYGQCPSCHSQNGTGCHFTEIICQNCGMQYLKGPEERDPHQPRNHTGPVHDQLPRFDNPLTAPSDSRAVEELATLLRFFKRVQMFTNAEIKPSAQISPWEGPCFKCNRLMIRFPDVPDSAVCFDCFSTTKIEAAKAAKQASIAQEYGTSRMPTDYLPSDSPFKCDRCPRAFTEKQDLERHLSIHSIVGAVRTFQCRHCNRGFTRKEALKRHRLRTGCGKPTFDAKASSFEKKDESLGEDRTELVLPDSGAEVSLISHSYAQKQDLQTPHEIRAAAETGPKYSNDNLDSDEETIEQRVDRITVRVKELTENGPRANDKWPKIRKQAHDKRAEILKQAKMRRQHSIIYSNSDEAMADLRAVIMAPQILELVRPGLKDNGFLEPQFYEAEPQSNI